MKVRIEIDTKTFVRFWLVVIGFGLAGLMIYSAKDALILVGIALFLAVALNGPVAKLASFMPGKSRLGGTALAFTLIVLVLGSVTWLVIPPVVQQTAKFVQTIPSLVDQANTQWVGLGNFIDQNHLRPQVDSALNDIKDQSATWAANAGANILGSVGSIVSFIVSLFLVIVMSFLMLLEGPTWMKRIWGVYRDEERMRRHRAVLQRIHGVVTGYVTGQLVVAAIGALAAGACVFTLSFFFEEVPINLFMPTMTIVFIFTLIPMFGVIIAGVLVGLLLLFNSLTAAIIYVIFFIIYQQIENNVISPTIQAKQVELSALAVLVAVTVGVYVAGIGGGLIAIPIAGTIKVLIEEYLRNRPGSSKPSKKPLKKVIADAVQAKSS